MKTIEEIRSEIDEDFKLGAVKCVEDIIAIMEKEKRDTQSDDTMQFTNKNIENLDAFFKEIVIILLYKGYLLKQRDYIKDGEHIIEIYLNMGVRGSEKYFENIEKNTGNSAYRRIKTSERFLGRLFPNEEETITDKLNDIERKIRQSIIYNKNSKEIEIRCNIPNEGDKPLEYYCENDENLEKIVEILENSGYECDTKVNAGIFLGPLKKDLCTIKEGFYYRNLIVKW